MQLSAWPRGSQTSTLTMYHASKMRMQMHWASLAASLTLPAGAVEKIFVHSHDLYCPRIALEDYQEPTGDCQGKEVLESSTGPETGDSLTLIMSYTTSCLRTPKKRLPLEGKPPNSTIMRSHECCIVDRMTGSCSLPIAKRGTGGIERSP